MEYKQETILQIIDVMQKNDISLQDIAEEMAKQPMPFDLLYRIGIDTRRIPFSERRKFPPESIRAIFPFNTNVYLEFSEHKFSRRYYHEDIPTIEYFEQLFEIKDKLNICLAELEKPLLDGEYFATRGRTNWIVGFDNTSDHLVTGCYDDSVLAKVRFYGKFEE